MSDLSPHEVEVLFIALMVILCQCCYWFGVWMGRHSNDDD